MDSLIEISKYNCERLESPITGHQCRRETPPAGSAGAQRVSHPAAYANGQNIIMYGDELGKPMGLQTRPPLSWTEHTKYLCAGSFI
ncbi:hypothetical protein EVAR_36284_1 [Eumeta japonica]|uniref:Uncharacterized protein n=1 Tax=Eumeta variegata TaxID=151549 RepID=A0A4C1VIW1_EUMVA|nr:hypothetical protein EVAR_36284_1 [Eumeta japonica]